ncbi:MAG TPA: cytochrome C oxidase subunit IV family protein [Opitutaceae bacterium]|nr:cytochrome C oxidase subunit IV family protein [Opitutaceae bacterium]
MKDSAARTLLLVYASLLAILAASAGLSRVLAGVTGTAVALGLAAAKTALVFLFFMRLRRQSGLVRVFALAGFFWLTLLAVFVAADYLTRA